MPSSRTNKPENGKEVLTCGRCGQSNVETRLEPDSFDYGEGRDAVRLSVVVPVHGCRDCQFKYVDESAEDIYHEAVCRHLGVLTPSEIRDIRERHGLSRRGFAELTKLGEATIARWERGALIQNAAYDQFMYLLRHARNLQDLCERQPGPLDSSLASTVAPARREPRFRSADVEPRLPQLIRDQQAFELRPTGT